MDMLMAPVARFAAMNTGNRLRLTAAKISDLCGFRLQADTRAGGAEGRILTVACIRSQTIEHASAEGRCVISA